MSCKNCGREIYRAMTEAYPSPKVPVFSNKLPEFTGMKHITFPLDSVKEFNGTLTEVGQFAAWVCGVPFEKFNRMDMMTYIMKRERKWNSKNLKK